MIETAANHARNASLARFPSLRNSLAHAWVTSFGPTGQTLRDYARYSHHGAMQSMVQADWVHHDPVGWMISGNGSPKYIDVGADGFVPMVNGARQFSYSVWFKRNSAGAACCAWSRSTNTVHRTNGNIHTDGRCYLTIDTSDRARFDSNDTNLHHLAYTFDGDKPNDTDKIRGYLDGIEQTLDLTASLPSALDDNPNTSFLIGREPVNNTYLDGAIGNLFLFNRTLTPAEILILCRHPLAPLMLHVPNTRLTIAIGSAVSTGTVSPDVLTLSIPAVAAAVAVSGNVDPDVLTLAIPSVAATVAVSGNVDPDVLTLSMPAVAAGVVTTGNSAPDVLTLSIPAVAATVAVSGTPAPDALTLSIPSVAATVAVSGSVAPDALTLSIPAITATSGTTGTAAPDVLTLSAPAVAATVSVSGTPAPDALTLSIPSVAATVAVSGTVAPDALTLSIPAVAASTGAAASGTPTPAQLSLKINEPAAGPTASGLADPDVLTLAIPAVAAISTVDGFPAPVTMLLQPVATAAAAHVTASTSPMVLTLAAPTVGAGAGFIAGFAVSAANVLLPRI